MNLLIFALLSPVAARDAPPLESVRWGPFYLTSPHIVGKNELDGDPLFLAGQGMNGDPIGGIFNLWDAYKGAAGGHDAGVATLFVPTATRRVLPMSEFTAGLPLHRWEAEDSGTGKEKRKRVPFTRLSGEWLSLQSGTVASRKKKGPAVPLLHTTDDDTSAPTFLTAVATAEVGVHDVVKAVSTFSTKQELMNAQRDFYGLPQTIDAAATEWQAWAVGEIEVHFAKDGSTASPDYTLIVDCRHVRSFYVDNVNNFFVGDMFGTGRTENVVRVAASSDKLDASGRRRHTVFVPLKVKGPRAQFKCEAKVVAADSQAPAMGAVSHFVPSVRAWPPPFVPDVVRVSAVPAGSESEEESHVFALMGDVFGIPVLNLGGFGVGNRGMSASEGWVRIGFRILESGQYTVESVDDE
eukprot:Hpha_TRINITY_DN25909_c0_g1::TRINITY_DN25909_c0_g1_i1::g.185375::m.185375